MPHSATCHFKVVTNAATAAEWASLLFGWKVCKHVKSNAIVYVRGEETLGIGAGQMARVDVRGLPSGRRARPIDLKGSVVASEALFPFADGLIAAAEPERLGHPAGGSVRDAEVMRRPMPALGHGLHRIRHFKH